MSLRAKFSLTAALLLAILGLLLTQWFVEHERQLYTNGLVARGGSMVRTLAFNATVPLAFGDDQVLQRLTDSLLHEPEVRYVLVLDDKGTIIASSGSAPSEIMPRVLAESALPDPSERRFSGAECQHLMIGVGAPATATHGALRLGSAVVGISTSANENRIREGTHWAVFMMCVVVLCAIFIFSFLAGIITRPLEEMTRGTERIAAGDLSHRVRVDRADELGHVATSFNDMACALQRSRDDLTRINQELARANEELKNWGTRLEEEVTRRTAELKDANEALQRMMREKEDFLRAVSHDLNAPLRNIAGMASLILRRQGPELDATVQDRVRRIQANVQREMEMIQALLDMSRIRTEKRTLVPVSVGSLVEDVRSQLDFQIEERNVDLRVETPLPVLTGDPHRLKQIFQNLIENAIKYNQHARPVVRVGAERRGADWHFWIADNGIGIPAEEQERIFWLFRRGRDQRVANVPGKGVGLAHVRSIVEIYGGRITVESQPGAGSTFRIVIPVAAFEAMPTDTPSAPEPAAASGVVPPAPTHQDASPQRALEGANATPGRTSE